ncbi:hypothetical protein KUTeg_009324 [Tegillarca granosa]|uniref:Uncharacterized protein n=1 Tax=Tegillarca granosa TaxID=220873 RepID=A0ABQ9FBS9_TEGGR|nr:hypothetical protein KUTeg_009324 [Tegillarca granosa]
MVFCRVYKCLGIHRAQKYTRTTGRTYRYQYHSPVHTDIYKQLEELGAFMPVKRCRQDSNCSLPGPSNEFDFYEPLPGPSVVSDDFLSNQQSGGGNGDQLVYEIEKVGQKTFKNRVIDRHYRVKFNPDQVLEGQKLSDLNVELENMFDDVLNEAKKDLKGSDLGRVIIHHDDLINPIFVPLRPLDDLNADTVLNYLEKTLTSHQDLAMDDGFYLDVLRSFWMLTSWLLVQGWATSF